MEAILQSTIDGGQATVASSHGPLGDGQLVESVLGGDHRAFETLMRRYNQRLFRVVRSVLRDDAEAEDAVQETYIRAYLRLGQLSEPAAFGGWLTRIAANEALERVRRGAQARRSAEAVSDDIVQDHAERMLMAGLARDISTPEEAAAAGEIRRLLERAIDSLPDTFRTVFILRAVEQLSTTETAACLGLRPMAVKTRYFRAKMHLRKALERSMMTQASTAFPFAGARCDRIVSAVLNWIASQSSVPGPFEAAVDGDAPHPGSVSTSRYDRRTR